MILTMGVVTMPDSAARTRAAHEPAISRRRSGDELAMSSRYGPQPGASSPRHAWPPWLGGLPVGLEACLAAGRRSAQRCALACRRARLASGGRPVITAVVVGGSSMMSTEGARWRYEEGAWRKDGRPTMSR
eukprot:gene456-biopygen6450